MNQDMKEAVLTLLAGRKYIFTLLHKVLGAEPTKALLSAVSSEDSMKAIALFESDESSAPKALQAALLRCRNADDAVLEAVKSEYTRLFIGPDEMPAPPWESVYITKERALFQQSTLAVRYWYQRYGYLPAGYPCHPDDHISLMMHFMALLTEKAIERMSAGDEEQYAHFMKEQKTFEENHLLSWVHLYADDMGKQEAPVFYPQLVRAMAEFVAYDRQILDELCEGV